MHTEPPASEGASGDGAAGDRRDRLWRGGIAVLLVGILIRLVSDTMADPDLWGHIRFGELTRRLGGVTLADPYSYLTLGHPWINHEWLSEVIFSKVWDSLHTPGLVALKTAFVVVILLLVYRRLWRSGLGPLRAGLVLVALAIPALLGLGTVRPQLFTYLAFVLTLLILERAERGGAAGWLWLLPPLFAVWVNLHGGVLAGLGVLVVWAASRVVLALQGSWRRRRAADGGAAAADGGAAAADGGGRGPRREAPRPGALVAIAVALAAAGALLLNPYGVRLPLFLLRTATVPRPDISEWKALPIRSSLGLVYLAYVVGGAWILRSSPRRPRPALLAVLGVVAILPLTAVRHLPLFGLALGVLLAPDLGAVLGPKRRHPTPGGRAAPWLAALAGLVGVLTAARSIPSFRCIEMGPQSGGLDYPARAVGLLQRSGARGNLAVFFNWGEYAIWKLEPAMKVGMDGRRETVYPDFAYREYLDWLGGVGDWDRFLELGPADLALVPRDRPVYNLMSLSPGWPRVYQDTLAAVFARRGSADAARVRAARPPDLPPDGRGMCFP